MLLAELISGEAGRADRESEGNMRHGNGGDGHEGEGGSRRGKQGLEDREQEDLLAPGRWSVADERVLELGAGA